MSERLVYGKNPPFSLVEQNSFSYTAPYIIKQKTLLEDDFAIMHYSNSIELTVCCNAEGYAVVEYDTIQIAGNTVVIVPPNIVHSVSLKKGEGCVYVMHISLEYLSRYLDLNEILKIHGVGINDLNHTSSRFDDILGLIRKMIEDDDNIFLCMSELLQIFDIVFSEVRISRSVRESFSEQNNQALHSIIQWTEQNYMKNISLEDAASSINLSRNYFCHWFKQMSGLTFNTYLTNVRIAKACLSILKTHSASITAHECGFGDPSYFNAIFKKKVGITPLQYYNRKTSSNPSRADE